MRLIAGALWLICNLQAIEYSYPVAIDQENAPFYIHQKSLSDLDLWQYCPQASGQTKCLYWRFLPAGLKLLPDRSGFSFIDSNRLRLKKFIKRSPRSVDFDQPVYGVSEVNWLDNNICYFSAKQKEHFAIFYGDVKSSNLACVYQVAKTECLSPRIIANCLFCIERSSADRSCGITMQSAPIVTEISDDYKFKPAEPSQLVVDCGYQQIIYLEMLSPQLGFYIEHMPYIQDHSGMITFICHQLVGPACWRAKPIFKFQVPKKYLFGEERLCESIMPFLPRWKKTVLYFSDIKQTASGEYYSSLHSYDLMACKFNTILTSIPPVIFFAPLPSDHDIFYGIIKDKIGEEVKIASIKIPDQN